MKKPSKQILSLSVHHLAPLLLTCGANAAPDPGAQQLPAPTPFAVASRDLHSRSWARTVYEATPIGPIAKKHSYQEVALNLHYRPAPEAPLQETIERFDLLGDGSAAATNGPHKLFVPADIRSAPILAIDSNGREQQMRPWGISYFDGTNSVLLANLTNL